MLERKYLIQLILNTVHLLTINSFQNIERFRLLYVVTSTVIVGCSTVFSLLFAYYFQALLRKGEGGGGLLERGAHLFLEKII